MARKLTVSLELNLDKFAAGLKTGLNMGKRFKMNFDKVMGGIDIDVDKVGFQQDLKSLERQYEKFEKDIENDEIDIRTGGGFSKLANFGIVAGTVTMGLQQIGSAARNTIRPYVEFEKSLSRINTIADVSEQKLSALGDGMEEIATTVGTDMSELADGMYEALSRGVEFGNSLEFIEQTAKAAKGGTTDLRSTVRSTTTVLNAFNMDGSKTQQVLDTMFTTVEKGGTSFEDLSNHIADVAPIAASAGVDFKEVGTAIATVTKQGTPTAKATTQIKRAILSLNDVLGEGWSETMSLQEGMQKVVEMAENSDKSLKELVGRVQAYQGILQLTGDSADIYEDANERIQDSTGATDSAFRNMANDMQHQIDILNENWADMKRNLTQMLLPGVNATISGFNELTSSISDLLDGPEKKLSTRLREDKQRMNELFTAIQDANTSQETRNRLINELNKNYGDYFDNQITEKTNLEDIKEAQEEANQALMDRIATAAAEEEIKKLMKEKVDVYDEYIKKEKEAQEAQNQAAITLAEYNKKFDKNMTLSEAYRHVQEKNLGVWEQMDTMSGNVSNRLTGLARQIVNVYKEQGFANQALKNHRQEWEEVRDEIAATRQKYVDMGIEIANIGEKQEDNNETTGKAISQYARLSEKLNIVTSDFNRVAKALKSVKKESDEVSISWENVEVEGMRIINIAQSMGKQFTDTLSDAFTEMADEGTLSFQRIGEAFENTLIQMASEMAAKAGIFALFTAFTGGTGATARLLSAGKAETFTDYIFGSFAEGGSLPAYEIGLVGENGPELIMPQQDTEIIDTETLERVLTQSQRPVVKIEGGAIPLRGELRGRDIYIANKKAENSKI